eukprot:scaffold117710_cov54-Attheya_sp.AAC.3
MTSFHCAAIYGFALGALILSTNVTLELITLFTHRETYTLGNFGQVWANWHAFGCIFVGLSNLAVVRDNSGRGFGPEARVAVAQNTAFIFGVWAVQNTYYCLVREDLFTPLMWLNAGGCLVSALWSLQAATKAAEKKIE